MNSYLKKGLAFFMIPIPFAILFFTQVIWLTQFNFASIITPSISWLESLMLHYRH